MSAEDFLPAQRQKLGEGLSGAFRDSEVTGCSCREVRVGLLSALGRDRQHWKEQHCQILLTPSLV